MHLTSSVAPRILVFDSGVGGLSIFAEIQQKLPHASLVYASDNAAFPYGTKGEAELIERVDKVLRSILAKHPIDIIVIACNTASTLTLPFVRSHFSQPVVGVVPAIKPAAALTKTGVIGLLATPATVARPYTHALIQEHAVKCRVISVGSSELVHLAEAKLRGGDIAAEQLTPILKPFFEQSTQAEPDVIVLACTHFPLLRDEIADCFPHHVQLIDSGEAIARRVVSLVADARVTHAEVANLRASNPRVSNPRTAAASLIGNLNTLNDHNAPSQAKHLALFTKATASVESLRPQLHQFGIHELDIVDV